MKVTDNRNIENYIEHDGINEGRIILHSDLNNFFASVECKKRPDLKDLCVAVCGSREDRHGIVLAKNEKAKKCGVKTAQAIWQAKIVCPSLVILNPDYNEYMYYSGKVMGIYSDYSDKIEPFGMDEAWIDLTNTKGINTLLDGQKIAQQIRLRIKKETGLTVSIGVSDNKTFSKLASDYKKPDAVTIFGPDNYRDTVSKVNIGEMLYVGPKMRQKLHTYGLDTIGEVALSNKDFLHSMFGVNGDRLYNNACGFDDSKVARLGEQTRVKSVGNSVTLPYDLKGRVQVNSVFHTLAETVAWRLRRDKFKCTVVQISVRGTDLLTTERQCGIKPTSNAIDIATAAMRLYCENYSETKLVRSVGIRTAGLISSGGMYQEDLFDNWQNRSDRLEQLDEVLDRLRERYGKGSLKRAICFVKSNCSFDSNLEIS